MLNSASRNFALRAAFMVDKHDGMLEQGKDLTDLASPNGIAPTASPTSTSGATTTSRKRIGTTTPTSGPRA